MIKCDRLQRVLQSRSHPYPLVMISQQGSQVPLFDRGHPNLRKAVLEEQITTVPFLYENCATSTLTTMGSERCTARFHI
jgi:hypothetical protein